MMCCQGQIWPLISKPGPKVVVQHADAALVAEGASKGLWKGHECREERQWSYWGLSQLLSVPNLSALDKSGGKQQSKKQSEMGIPSSTHEMNQVTGMDGASSFLKHISTHKLSGCSKYNKNEKIRRSLEELNIMK